MSKRTVTYVLSFDKLDLSQAPQELMQYLKPTSEVLNGVKCTALSEGDAITETHETEGDDDYIYPQFRHLIEEEESKAALVKRLHQEVMLHGKTPSDVLDDLFREYTLTGVQEVAA